jgi:hypothetical protein
MVSEERSAEGTGKEIADELSIRHLLGLFPIRFDSSNLERMLFLVVCCWSRGEGRLEAIKGGWINLYLNSISALQPPQHLYLEIKSINLIPSLLDLLSPT